MTAAAVTGTPEEAAAVIETEIGRLRALLRVEHSEEHEEAIHDAINDALTLRDRVFASPRVV